jgi:hypothetical protein
VHKALHNTAPRIIPHPTRKWRDDLLLYSLCGRGSRCCVSAVVMVVAVCRPSIIDPAADQQHHHSKFQSHEDVA